VFYWRSAAARNAAYERNGTNSVQPGCPGIQGPIFTEMFVYDTYSRGSVLLWRRSDTLCTSGFMDDVKFAHKPRLLDVAAQQLKRSAHAALGLAINCAQQYQLQANGRTGLLFGALKITSQVAAPGAESAVGDWLVAWTFSLSSRAYDVGV